MTIHLVTMFPDHLDLNGDQANLLVAKRRLGWLGFDVKISQIQKGTELPTDHDFIFVGHGSIAAWADIRESMDASADWMSDSIANGVGFMAVASGHEWSIQKGLLQGELDECQRVSKFEVAKLNSIEVLGYLNSSTTAPVIQKSGLVIGTQLHGPVFAKNPELVDSFFLELVSARKIVAKHETTESAKKDASLVAGIVQQVWDLEKELASE